MIDSCDAMVLRGWLSPTVGGRSSSLSSLPPCVDQHTDAGLGLLQLSSHGVFGFPQNVQFAFQSFEAVVIPV